MGAIIKHRQHQLGAAVAELPALRHANAVVHIAAAPRRAGHETPEAAPPPPGPTAEELLAAATAEAEAIREAAVVAAAAIREQAHRAGYEAGLAAAQATAAGLVDASHERLHALAMNSAADHAAMLREVERQALDLAIAVARAIVRREVEIDRDLLAASLDALLTHLEGEAVTSLRAHPDDVPLLSDLWAERAHAPSGTPAQIIADPRIGRGGCLLYTTTGAWDGTIETQFERIQVALRNAGGGD